MFRIVAFLALFGILSSVTHLILQNDDIYTKERSEYDLKAFSSLQKVLEQDELVREAELLLTKLEIVKTTIVDNAPLLNDEKVDENDCLESGLLSDFDFSILPALEKDYHGFSRFEQYMCIADTPSNIPDCSNTPPTFFMGDYQHIAGVSHVTEKTGAPAYSLLPFIPTDDIALFGHCLQRHLFKNSTNWHVYFGASFYWRLQGNDVAALSCIFKSLYYAQNDRELIDGPLVTLANLLSNAGYDSDAALVMEHSAMTPFLKQLKLWSAGNLYTMSEQYKLSLDLYNETLKLGPFPLADERLQTMECYSSVIQRMEKQNSVLRTTLQKLRERHELETQYIGVQERLFSNLNNATLPGHVILQITNTEEAVRNTYKLVIEQQEIQNTLSPNKGPHDKVEVVVDDLDKLLETKARVHKKQKSVEVKKDINWIRSTRIKLEELVDQIKSQLSDPSDIPVVYIYDEEYDETTEGITVSRDEFERIKQELINEQERYLMDEYLEQDAEVIPPAGDYQDEEEEEKEPQEPESPRLSTNVFPLGDKIPKEVRITVNNQGAESGCEFVQNTEQNSWFQLKCKLSNDNKSKTDKEVKLVIRENSLQVPENGSKILVLSPNIKCGAGKSSKSSSKMKRRVLDEASLGKLITDHLQTRDIFDTMANIRKDTIFAPAETVETPVNFNFGEEDWVLRMYKIDTSPSKVVRIEQCDRYTPVFSHGDPYLPIFKSSFTQDEIIKKILVHNSNTPFSPDCTTHMDLDNCFSCYDDLSGVNREEYDTRHILEDFALSELEALGIDVQYLGFAIDLALRKDPNSWQLYHIAALYHRTFTFELGPAIQCTRRALAVVDGANRPEPLLTLTNLLHQARSIPDATVVVLELLATDPNEFLHHIESSVLQVAIGKPSGQFRASLDALNVPHSSLADHQLNSLLCYYDILKEPDSPPFHRFVHSKRISRDKKHPPFSKPPKPPIDGEIWRLEHHEGIFVDITWVK